MGIDDLFKCYFLFAFGELISHQYD